MKFAWSGGDLQQRFAAAASSVQHVLSVLAHADTMRDVRGFHSLQLFPVPPTLKHQGRLLIRHKEIDVTTELLADDTAAYYESDAASPAWMDPIRRVRIVSIVTNA